MKPRILAAFIFSVLTGFLLSCSTSSEIRITGTNFTDEVSQAQNLVFTFSEDLVPKSGLDAWDSTQYIRFEPAIRGQFKWSAANELIFSPAAGFPAATAIKATPTEALTRKIESDKKWKVSGEALHFHTPYLQLSEVESWWALSKETGRQEARLRLIFNYPVSGQEVSNLLKIKSADKEIGFRSVGGQDDRKVDIVLEGTVNAGNNAVPLSVLVDKGLKASNTKYVTSEALTKTINLSSPLHLEVIDVRSGFENNTGFVRVVTSQQLAEESISGGFSINPAVTAQTEITENGFILRGDFNESDTYVMSVNKSLRSILGPAIEEEISKDLFFGQMPAAISFAHKKALYLSKNGARNIGIQIVNVPKVQVKISKLYSNNILSYIRNNRWGEYAWNGDESYLTGAFYYSDDQSGDYTDVLVNKTVETENLAKSKGIAALNIPMPDDHKRRGVYLVSVNSKEEAYLGATKLVSISDIGLIAKQGKDEIWVFANSIQTNEPIKDLEVTLVSSNNQVVFTGNTDGNGLLKVDKLGEKAPGFRIAMITAGNDEDFNYILLEDTRVETSRFEVDGARDHAAGIQAFIYGQRDIYRPGETMYFNTVLRTEQWKHVENVPLKFRLLTPNGREYRTWRKMTNAQGAADLEVAVDAAGLTGTYVLEVYNGNDLLLASHGVSVEEFIPDRIKVELSGGAKSYQTGQTVALTAIATNLFGPPAANRTYEMESQLKRKGFATPAFPDYIFDIAADNAFERERRQGTTNDRGEASEKFVLTPGLKDIGVLEGKIYVTVFDENGRPVNRLQRFDVYTQKTFYGIHLPDSYVGTNAPVPVELVGVTATGALQKGTAAKVEVVRMEYQTVVEKKYERLQYTSRKMEKVVYSNNITLPEGRGKIQYVPTISGEYEVRVRRPGAVNYTSAQFYAYSFGATQYSSFEVSNEGRVLMETDKASYKTGESARVLFKTPFDGRLLVSIERNHVLEHHILQTDKKAAELSFKIQEAHLPNVFVSATLIRKLDDSQIPLTVAHGFVPVLVEDAERKLPVTISAVEKSRSKTKQHIKVKTAPNAQVTLAIVDEGILQIKNSKTPDIYGHFYQKRALEVTSHDLYAQLFPDLKISATSSSGGDGYDLERRVNPLSNGRTQLVSFWSGILTANGNGEADFDVNIPQFSGDLRVMAVAYKGNAFGSGTKNMKVADPVVISVGAPRFLSPEDELSLPVNISNTESKAAKATVSLSLAGPLQAGADNATQTFTIDAGKETRKIFTVKARQAIGQAKIIVKVNAFGETFQNQTELSVRPASPLLKTGSSGEATAGKDGLIDLASSFIPGTSRSQVTLSRSPLVQGGGKAFAMLLGYPHGCLEQTVSKAFPQIYFADLAKAVAAPVYLAKNGENDLNPTSNVQQAIRKIESQQLFSGGLTMWPGQTEEDWWATAYAVHFLFEAKRAGFEINEKTFSKALDYLTSKTGVAATKEVIVASNDNGLQYPDQPAARTQVRKVMARREAIYSLYVLALSGHPNKSSMNYYKQNPGLLTQDEQYLLAGAFQLSGDGRSAGSLTPRTFTLKNNTGADDSFSSPLRNMALVLNTLLETDPQNPQVNVLARQLSQVVRSASYLNTQEASFAVLALGKIARKTAVLNATATVFVKGKPLAEFSGKEIKISKGIQNQKLTVKTKGNGPVYWFAQSEGMSATGNYTEEDQGISIRRQFLSRDGVPLQAFKQNDLVVVRLTLSSINGLPVENIVVTDLLPSGFEIENPRVTEAREMPWIKAPAIADYYDIRDDRIHFFTSADKAPKTFYYQVRIVSKGTFTVGPAAADAMYQGDYRSYSGGGKITVD